MGTRSRIAIQKDDGSFDSIYVHWDGYLSYVGTILDKHYRDPDKVKALVALGGVSSLGIDIGFPADTTAYHRDRGEDLNIDHSADLAALSKAADDGSAEYLYVFAGDNWFVSRPGFLRSAFGAFKGDNMTGIFEQAGFDLLSDALKERETLP